MTNHKPLTGAEIAEALARSDEALRRLHVVALHNFGIDLRHAYSAIQDGARALRDLQAKNERIAALETALASSQATICAWTSGRDVFAAPTRGEILAMKIRVEAALKGDAR